MTESLQAASSPGLGRAAATGSPALHDASRLSRTSDTARIRSHKEMVTFMRDRFDQMSNNDRKIATYISQNPNGLAICSAEQVAASCGVHVSSVVRFAQHLGFSGFREFKQVIGRCFPPPVSSLEYCTKAFVEDAKRRRQRGAKVSLAEVIASDAEALKRLIIGLEKTILDEAVSILAAADTIYLIGPPVAEPVAVMLRYALTMLGRKVVLIEPADGLMALIGRSTTVRDVVIVVSMVGAAKNILDFVKSVAAKAVPVIGILDAADSPLVKSCHSICILPLNTRSSKCSIAPAISLAQGLVCGLSTRLGDDGGTFGTQ